MGKRIRKLTILAIMVSVLLYGKSMDAKAGTVSTTAYNIEQAQGKAPVVKAYVNGRKISAKSTFTGKVTGTDFSEDARFSFEEMTPFSKTGEGIHYIILLDNLGSVSEKQFAQAKKELFTMRKSMRKADKMSLYTVGSNKATGEKVCVFKAEGRKNIKKQLKAIKKIKRNKKQTVLYRSLNQTLETVDNQSMRTVVMLITDGEDDSQGKNNRSYQVNSAVKNSKVPIYGILLKNDSKHPNKEKMRNTRKNILDEKISRGYYEECGTVSAVKKGFKNIKKILFRETYVASFREENNSNKTTMDASLTLICNGTEFTLGKGKFSYNQIGEADTQAPTISKIKKTGNNAIQFIISDDKTQKVLGADKKENYSVKDKKGRDWEIDRININTIENTYELIFKEKLYSGKYTIQCNNITDDSQEKNEMKDAYKFTFKGLSETKEGTKNAVKNYWWIGLIVIVIVIGIIIIFIVKKRSGKIEDVNPESLVKADTKLIRLTITDRAGTVKDVEWNVEGSIFVGRSDICNIYFDDDRLSRQHFAIEVTKMACYIEDLETTNATFVNGVKISGKRMLLDGDVITAGREKFVFHTVADGGGDES